MTWPFFTIELKSAYSSWTMPRPGADLDGRDRLSVPVAPTASTMSPRVTCAVVTSGSLAALGM